MAFDLSSILFDIFGNHTSTKGILYMIVVEINVLFMYVAYHCDLQFRHHHPYSYYYQSRFLIAKILLLQITA